MNSLDSVPYTDRERTAFRLNAIACVQPFPSGGPRSELE